MEGTQSKAAQDEFSYFDIQSTWGVTKHMGGLKATDELAALCHIDADKYVLEVGCGVGLTACHLVQRYGCRLLGVDISPKMVEWAHKRAHRKGVQDRAQFRVADAQDLPFEQGQFDVVLSESVTAFPEDKGKTVSEYVRVARPGAYVGLNEGTWLKPSPPAELVEYVARTMAGARFLTAEGWQALLQNAGLTDVTVKPAEMNALSQRLDEMAGLDWHDWLERLRAWGVFFGLYLRQPAFRRYARQITPSRRIIRDLFGYLGYGLYVGRKS